MVGASSSSLLSEDDSLSDEVGLELRLVLMEELAQSCSCPRAPQAQRSTTTSQQVESFGSTSSSEESLRSKNAMVE